jgi:lipoprotein-anchoring transpeptidase ErfK/SrfK
MGNGYAIHGTNQPQTVGRAVSHGCVRFLLSDEDLAQMLLVRAYSQRRLR